MVQIKYLVEEWKAGVLVGGMIRMIMTRNRVFLQELFKIPKKSTNQKIPKTSTSWSDDHLELDIQSIEKILFKFKFK